MKQQLAPMIVILALASRLFSQQATMELQVNDRVFVQDTTIDVAPNCSLTINCRIISKSAPTDSLKLFYGVNAPNDIIVFPVNGGSFSYIPQAQDTSRVVVLDFRLFYGESPLSSLHLSINVSAAVVPTRISAPLKVRQAVSSVPAPGTSFSLSGRMIGRNNKYGTSLAFVQKVANGDQSVVKRFAR